MSDRDSLAPLASPSLFRTLQYESRISALAGQDNALKTLAAENLFMQVEIGRRNLHGMEQMLTQQGQTNQEMHNLAATAQAMHKAIDRTASEQKIDMDQRFHQLDESLVRQTDRFQDAIHDLDEDLVNAIEASGELVADAIDCACEALQADLKHVSQVLSEQHATLRSIESALRNPGDVVVKELLGRATELLQAGAKSQGKWQQENWVDALDAARKATTYDLGRTNGFAWYLCGCLIWNCEGLKAAPDAASLQEARDAFEKAARHFQGRNPACYTQALQALAFMHYKLGAFTDALAFLEETHLARNDFDITFEQARYEARCGRKEAALADLRWCIKKRASSIFTAMACSDFEPIFFEIPSLVARMRADLESCGKARMVALNEELCRFPAAAGASAGQGGTLHQHQDLTKLLDDLCATGDYLRSVHLLDLMAKQTEAIRHTPTPPFELARIVAHYGLLDHAQGFLIPWLQEHPANISDVLQDPLFKAITKPVVASLAEKTDGLRRESTSAIAKLERIALTLAGERKRSGQSVVFSSEYARILEAKAHLGGMHYAEVLKLQHQALTLAEAAFLELPFPTLTAPSSPAAKERVFAQKDDGSLGKNAHYYLECAALLASEYPQRCHPETFALGNQVHALKLYRTKAQPQPSLQMVDSNGLCSFWKFTYTLPWLKGEGTRIACLPHKKPGGLFKAPTPFQAGDPLKLSDFHENILTWLKDPTLRQLLDFVRQAR